MKRAATLDSSKEFTDFLHETCLEMQYVLVHVVSGKGCSRLGPLVRRFDLPHPHTNVDIEALADRILSAVQQDCRGIGFAQKYGVFVFDERRSSEHLARFILSTRPRA